MVDIFSFIPEILTAFLVTSATLNILARIAPLIHLTDNPSERKQHIGEIPVVGGLAIFLSLTIGALIWGDIPEAQMTASGREIIPTFLLASAVLIAGGVIDDRYDSGALLKFLSEALAAIIVIEALDLRITYLGDLFGVGMIVMSDAVSYGFTVIAIVGLINAFNMLDGIDGLLASLIISTIFAFHLLTLTIPGFISLYLVASLTTFLFSNFGVTPLIPKTFLGDAGSRLLGFVVVCLLLGAASAQIGNRKLIEPVTALFLVAIPLFDMVFIIIRRIASGSSPVNPDRSHIHHLLTDRGLSHPLATSIIVFVNLLMSSLGLLLHRLEAPEYYQLALFITLFIIYFVLMGFFWKKFPTLNTST